MVTRQIGHESGHEDKSERSATANASTLCGGMGIDSIGKACAHAAIGPANISATTGEESSARATSRCGLDPQAKVHTCYEAGRDGWWLHRWLREQGVDSIVVDS
jgi:hypothetical protein